MADRAQAMSHNEGGTPALKTLHGPLDLGFCHVVKSARCFVKNEDGRRAKKRPGKGNALPLPAGKADAPLPHSRVIALGKAPNKDAAWALSAAF